MLRLLILLLLFMGLVIWLVYAGRALGRRLLADWRKRQGRCPYCGAALLDGWSMDRMRHWSRVRMCPQRHWALQEIATSGEVREHDAGGQAVEIEFHSMLPSPDESLSVPGEEQDSFDA